MNVKKILKISKKNFSINKRPIIIIRNLSLFIKIKEKRLKTKKTPEKTGKNGVQTTELALTEDMFCPIAAQSKE